MRATVRGRLLLAAVMASFIAFSAAPALPQDAAWPDGEYIGIFTGGGQAAGSFEGFSFEGKVVVGGTMELSILGGLAEGEYDLRYAGFGQGGGDSGSQVILEFGTVEGEDAQPVIHRKTADITITAQGVTLPLGTRPLPPSPAPLIALHQECGMIEGFFESKLAGLEDAFAMFGIKTEAEEGFMVLRTDLGTPDKLKKEILSSVDRLSEIAADIIVFAAKAEQSVGTAISGVEQLLEEVELILADLDGLALCTPLDSDSFALGISKALETFIEAALEEAQLQGESEAAVRLAALAARGGILGFVADFGAVIVEAMAFDATAAKDLAALHNLMLAATMFGDTGLAKWIQNEIDAIRGSS